MCGQGTVAAQPLATTSRVVDPRAVRHLDRAIYPPAASMLICQDLGLPPARRPHVAVVQPAVVLQLPRNLQQRLSGMQRCPEAAGISSVGVRWPAGSHTNHHQRWNCTVD